MSGIIRKEQLDTFEKPDRVKSAKMVKKGFMNFSSSPQAATSMSKVDKRLFVRRNSPPPQQQNSASAQEYRLVFKKG